MTLAGTELQLVSVPSENAEVGRSAEQEEKKTGISSVVETVKNFNYKKYLPWIIGAVILIIVLKSAGKKSVVS